MERTWLGLTPEPTSTRQTLIIIRRAASWSGLSSLERTYDLEGYYYCYYYYYYYSDDYYYYY